MREILFRVWDVIKKKYIPNDCYALISKTDFNAFGVMLKDWEDYKEGEYFYDIFQKIEQFTGLTDKNGVKIFEGDIIKTDDNDIINVSYGIQNIDAFETIGFNLYEFYGNYKDRGKGIRLQSSIEIIGNIHE